MVRATTGGVLRGYRSNLMNSFITLNKARETVLTQRNFNSYAEDPASAAQAFQLRKSRMDVESQYNICDSAYRKYQTAWSCLDTTDKLIDTDNGSALKTLKGMTLKMLNDPTGDARKTLSTALGQLSETIVQTMNQKYGDKFIFAGADGKNVPFEVKDEKLYYRGCRWMQRYPMWCRAATHFVRSMQTATLMTMGPTILNRTVSPPCQPLTLMRCRRMSKLPCPLCVMQAVPQ